MNFNRRESRTKLVAAHFLTELPEVTFTGWLKKECDNRLLRNFSRKYGIIYKDCLYLYENEAGSKATHVYNITNIRVQCIRENEQWGFNIEVLDEKHKGKRMITFLVGSQHEMTSWIEHLTSDTTSSKKVLACQSPTERYITIPDHRPHLSSYDATLPKPYHYKSPSSNFCKSDSLPSSRQFDMEHYQKPRSQTIPNEQSTPLPLTTSLSSSVSASQEIRPTPKPKPRPCSQKFKTTEPDTEEEMYIDMTKLTIGNLRSTDVKVDKGEIEESDQVIEQPIYSEINNIVGPMEVKDRNILPESIFKLHLDRENVTMLLQKDGTPGVYVIRKNANGEYVISALLLGSVKHYIIYQEDDKLFLKHDGEPRFSKLADLIRNYMRLHLPTCHARLEVPYGGQ